MLTKRLLKEYSYLARYLSFDIRGDHLIQALLVRISMSLTWYSQANGKETANALLDDCREAYSILANYNVPVKRADEG